MTDLAHRPWWRRKRAIAVAILLLAASYPLSFVPACWVLMRTDPINDPLAWIVLREIHRPTAVVLKACPKPFQDGVRYVTDFGAPEGAGLWIDSTTIDITTDVPDHDPTDSTITVTMLTVW